MPKNPNRRQVLAGSAALLAGCKEAGEGSVEQDILGDREVTERPPQDAGVVDGASEDDALSDGGGDGLQDTATDDAAQDGTTDGEPDVPTGEQPTKTKGPYWQSRGEGILRFRVETQGSGRLYLEIDGQRYELERTAYDVEFQWPPTTTLNIENPDLPGRFTIHQIDVFDLPAGLEVPWRLDGLTTGPIINTVWAPIERKTDATLGWVSDTMFPSSVGVGASMAAAAPGFLLHGGDIQYQTNPLDTWTGYFVHYGAVMQRAPMHYCIGNHDYDRVEEFASQYARLFGVQAPDHQLDYHAVTYAGWRILMLNSERSFWFDGAQLRWMDEELERTANNLALHGTIVAFHRPYYTLSRDLPNMEVREAMHPRWVEYGVPLVLTGHNHGYERFEVDGVTYIVDAGGGASLYSTRRNAAAVDSLRPGESDLQVADSSSFGWLSLQLRLDGSIEAQRIGEGDIVVDSFTVPRP
ncbi:MAG: putative phosphodiesterase [Bradymonadia bacterium]|jgi:predicted phosphodiesterase